MSEFFNKYPIGSYVSINCFDRACRAKVVGQLIYGPNEIEYLFVVFDKPNSRSWVFSDYHLSVYFGSLMYDFESSADISDYINRYVYCAKENELVKN